MSTPSYGRDSNSLLETVFGVPPRPDDLEQRLTKVMGLIDDDRLQEARTALGELASVVTEEDPEVVRLRSLLGFLEA